MDSQSHSQIRYPFQQPVAGDDSAEPLRKKQRIRDWMPALFPGDVALMFIGIFVANATAWWIWLPFHLATCLFLIWFLRLAWIASSCVPRSIPFQRPIGVFLYLSCHVVLFFGPAEIPIALVGYLLFAAPLSSMLLFDQLHGD